jgi:hypothetical protein
MSVRISSLLTAALVPLVLCAGASPAGAFDLTGTWQGRWTCKGFDGEPFAIVNLDSSMVVTQVGGVVTVDIDVGSLVYNGEAIDDALKPAEKGEVVLLQCGTDDVPLTTTEGEIVRATARTRIGRTKAMFRAVSIFEDHLGGVGTCRYSYKRLDTLDLGVPACP